MQDGVVGLVGMLHGDGLREFPQHPLLKVLQPFVVIAAADKLLVLRGGGDTAWGQKRHADEELLPRTPGLDSTGSFDWTDWEIPSETGFKRSC